MNRWCGPFALGFVNGKDADWGAERFRLQTGKAQIKGVSRYNMQVQLQKTCGLKEITRYNDPEVARVEVSDAQRMCGITRLTRVRGKDPRPTLAQWLRTRDRKGMYVINIVGHFVVVRGDRLFDNCNPSGVSIREYNGRRRRVQKVWRVR